ncbi:DUF6650 family protein [Melioribacter sp. Ez-97]|uniref:DUF6650 family protein n=1 Tax=Melioribacter sp. Ez-97 TaxID=3423434 RepID=UPI003EDB28BB
MNISFKKILKKLSGISTPVFGISWNPTESERDVVRKLFLFLEDKRVLFYPFHMEMPYHVNQSVLDIRKYLTDEILKLDENSDLLSDLKLLRAACRKFLDSVGIEQRRRHMIKDEMIALGELRAIFGITLAKLSIKYGVDFPKSLEEILPFEDDE